MKQVKGGLSKKSLDIFFVVTSLAIPVGLFLVFYLYTNFNSFIMAFQSTDILGNKEWVGLKNFADFINEIFSDGKILSISFTNSLKMYFINLLVCVPTYILFAYILFKKAFGNKVIRVLVMIPQVVSGMVITLVFKKFVDNALPSMMEQFLGWEDFPMLLGESKYIFGTTLFYMIWTSYAVNVIVYSNAMNEIPEEIIESAQLDGVDTMFKELWYIVLPLIYPTLTTFLVTGFASILSQTGPIMAFYYDSAPDVAYNMGYYFNLQLMKQNELQYNMLAAGGLVMTILVAPLTYLIKRLLEKYGPEV